MGPNIKRKRINVKDCDDGRDVAQANGERGTLTRKRKDLKPIYTIWVRVGGQQVNGLVKKKKERGKNTCN